MIDAIADRIIAAFSTFPDLEGWLLTAALLGFYTLIALPLGLKLKFINVEVQKSWSKVAIAMVTNFFFPGLSEEFFFRVLLLPYPNETVSTVELFLWGSIGLVLFILYHPFEGFTYAKAQKKTMINPVFLSLAALLGITCTIAYLQTGSIWPSVVIHWIVVVVWRLCLSGDRELFGTPVEEN